MTGKTHYNKDYFNYGGDSEFCGHSLETQLEKINNGLKNWYKDKTYNYSTISKPTFANQYEKIGFFKIFLQYNVE